MKTIGKNELFTMVRLVHAYDQHRPLLSCHVPASCFILGKVFPAHCGADNLSGEVFNRFPDDSWASHPRVRW